MKRSAGRVSARSKGVDRVDLRFFFCGKVLMQTLSFYRPTVGHIVTGASMALCLTVIQLAPPLSGRNTTAAIEEQPSTFPAPSDTIVRVALSKPESFRRLAPYQLVYRVQAKAESELAHHYPRRLLLINPFSE